MSFMEITCPNHYLNPAEIGILLLPDVPGDHKIAQFLAAQDMPLIAISANTQPAWTDQSLLDTLKPPRWRQLLIITDHVGPYETGLVLMTLEIGFQVYLSIGGQSGSDFVLARLKQASAIILSHDDVIAELRIHKPLAQCDQGD